MYQYIVYYHGTGGSLVGMTIKADSISEALMLSSNLSPVGIVRKDKRKVIANKLEKEA